MSHQSHAKLSDASQAKRMIHQPIAFARYRSGPRLRLDDHPPTQDPRARQMAALGNT